MSRAGRLHAARRAATKFLWALASSMTLIGHGAAQTSVGVSPAPPPELDAAEVRAIAKEAWIYAFAPIVNYRALYNEAIDANSSTYVGGFGVYRHDATFHTAKGWEIFPNNDIVVSRAWLDLRAEPWVLSVPAVPGPRYNVFQWFDLYTHNFAYVGVRATGRQAGNYLFAGPGWHGKVPRGISKVFRSETSIIGTVTRTSLSHPDDFSAVKALQSEYRLMPLSVFLHESAPPSPSSVDWLPWDPTRAMGPDFISYLNLLMTFMRPAPASETEMLARFARIGIGPGRPFDVVTLDPATHAAIELGIGDGKRALAERLVKTTSTQDLFGTREELGSDYLLKRVVGARMELHGDSKAEAIHPAWLRDAKGEALVGTTHYQITFAAGEVPPVTEFWSATLYRLPGYTLVDNPIDRYSLGSRSPGLQYGPDGSLTLYVQPDSPGQSRESNWLPAPEGPFAVVLRLYGPKPQALDGTWKPPEVTAVP